MHLPNTLLDVAIGFRPDGPLSLMGLLAAVVLLEGLVLTVFKYKDLKGSFRDALIVNVVTTLVGFFLGMLDVEIYPGDLEGLLVFFVTSFVIEGALLTWLRKDFSLAKTWIAVVLMNVASYILFFVLSIALI